MWPISKDKRTQFWVYSVQQHIKLTTPALGKHTKEVKLEEKQECHSVPRKVVLPLEGGEKETEAERRIQQLQRPQERSGP